MVEREPQPQQQPTLEHPGGDARVADGTEQDDVVATDRGQVGVGQGVPRAVPPRGAEVVAGGADVDVVTDRRLQHLQAGTDDLGADPVPGDDGQVDGRRGAGG